MKLTWMDTIRRETIGGVEVWAAHSETSHISFSGVRISSNDGQKSLYAQVDLGPDEMRRLAAALLVQADYREQLDAELARQQQAAA